MSSFHTSCDSTFSPFQHSWAFPPKQDALFSKDLVRQFPSIPFYTFKLLIDRTLNPYLIEFLLPVKIFQAAGLGPAPSFWASHVASKGGTCKGQKLGEPRSSGVSGRIILAGILTAAVLHLVTRIIARATVAKAQLSPFIDCVFQPVDSMITLIPLPAVLLLFLQDWFSRYTSPAADYRLIFSSFYISTLRSLAASCLFGYYSLMLKEDVEVRKLAPGYSHTAISR
ncbi:16496_t:CDS:2 [Dentiscutata erythropus]|uniref:16496_t:CDS:1 n=1 Tax=Dentiscutata erythropus TaxID=1348616 RepID=A0A9N8WUY9_9GLOM|nr:16496_t:CDS:2 [Dentiscutata erythropus]